jgi:hypothetical protein
VADRSAPLLLAGSAGCATTGARSTAPSAAAEASAEAVASPSMPVAATASPSPTAGPSGGCVNPPTDLVAIVSLDPAARLACFGWSTLTFEAVVFKPIGDCGAGPQLVPGWFCLPGVFLAPPNAPLDGSQLIAVYWNPASGLKPASFPYRQTLRITGHFDDPAARTCHLVGGPAGQVTEPPADVVLACRETFVVTAVH